MSLVFFDCFSLLLISFFSSLLIPSIATGPILPQSPLCLCLLYLFARHWYPLSIDSVPSSIESFLHKFLVAVEICALLPVSITLCVNCSGSGSGSSKWVPPSLISSRCTCRWCATGTSDELWCASATSALNFEHSPIHCFHHFGDLGKFLRSHRRRSSFSFVRLRRTTANIYSTN